MQLLPVGILFAKLMHCNLYGAEANNLFVFQPDCCSEKTTPPMIRCAYFFAFYALKLYALEGLFRIVLYESEGRGRYSSGQNILSGS